MLRVAKTFLDAICRGQEIAKVDTCSGTSKLSKESFPYGKAVFVRISDEHAANILRTALFTVIVRYIFTSCRKYPANNVGLTKK